MFHSAFDLLSQPPEAYLIVFALALGDAVVPVLPSEAALITAGLLSVVGDLTLGWVIVGGRARCVLRRRDLVRARALRRHGRSRSGS